MKLLALILILITTIPRVQAHPSPATPKKKYFRKLSKDERRSTRRTHFQRYLLKAAPGIGATRISAFSHQNTGPALALSTHAGRMIGTVEFNLSSFLNAFHFTGMELEAKDTHIYGARGTFTSVAVGPTFLIPLPYSFRNLWTPYLLGGPLYAMETFKFSSANVDNNSFNKNHKITYTGPGLVLGFGLKELGKEIELKKYIEFIYKGIFAKKYSIVGGREIEVETLETINSRKHIEEHSFLLSMGIYFF